MMLLFYTFKACEEFYKQKYPEFVYMLLFNSVMVFVSFRYPPLIPTPSIGVFVDIWKLYGPNEQLCLQCALCVVQERTGQVGLHLGFPRAVREPPMGPISLVNSHRRLPIRRFDWYRSRAHLHLP